MNPPKTLRLATFCLTLATAAALAQDDLVHSADLPAEILERADRALLDQGEELRLGPECRRVEVDGRGLYEVAVLAPDGRAAGALVLGEEIAPTLYRYPASGALPVLDLDRSPESLEADVRDDRVLGSEPRGVRLGERDVLEERRWLLDERLGVGTLLETDRSMDPTGSGLLSFRFGDGTPGARVTLQPAQETYGSTFRIGSFETYRVHAWYDRNGNGLIDDPSVDAYSPRNASTSGYVFPRQIAIVKRDLGGGMYLPDVDMVAGRAFDSVRLASGATLRANVAVFVVFSSWHHPDLGARPQFALVSFHYDAASDVITPVSIAAGDFQRAGNPLGEIYVTHTTPSWVTDPATGKPILSGRFGPKASSQGAVSAAPWGVLEGSVFWQVLYNDPTNATPMIRGCLIQVDFSVHLDPRG